jgi:hypothetical protein
MEEERSPETIRGEREKYSVELRRKQRDELFSMKRKYVNEEESMVEE